MRVTVAVPPAQAEGLTTRVYWLHVPRGYRAGRPIPLILAFHGAGGTALGMQAGSGLSALADRRGFLVAYAQGLPEPKGTRHYYWYTSGPSDPDAHGIDDGLYTSDLISAVQARYCVDPHRVGAVGFSNGAGLMNYLACVLADRISAFVPVEGEFYMVPAGCRPAHPASILDIHARDDYVAPYAGAPARGSPDYYAPAAPIWLEQWAARDGCTRSAPVGAGGRQWSGCEGGALVAGELRARGGHSWPIALGGRPGSEVIASFILGHPLRATPAAWTVRPAVAVAAVRGSRLAPRSIEAYRVPTPEAKPLDVAIGSDGSAWFTEFDADKIGRIDPAGRVHEYAVPTPGAEPYQLIARPDGSVYFTEYNTQKLGEISAAGRISETAIAPHSAGGLGLAHAGATVWVADPEGVIDRIASGGRVQQLPAPASLGVPFAVAPGPEGSVWVSPVTGYFEHTHALLRLGGRLPGRTLTLANPASDVDALSDGPGGSVWAADYGAGQIDELSASGTLHRYEDPTRYGGLNDIVAGPGDAMWFTEQTGLIGRITLTGSIQELALEPAGSEPDGIAAAPDGSIWVADAGTDRILRLTLR